MRKLILAAVLIGLAAPILPAFAQQEGPTAEDRAEKRDKDNLDRQYNNALKAMQGTPSTAKSNDPWATMRAPTAPPPPAHSESKR
jgi:hypothetical protein